MQKTNASLDNPTDRRARALKAIQLLGKEYPNAKIALEYSNPLELLVATMLSAQCTDERVNKVTKELFKEYKTPRDYAKADRKKLEREIRSTGFFRNKARNIKATSKLLVEDYNSRVPRTMEDLLELPGVARKTANIVLQNAYNVTEGIAVDTHVRRISKRLGLTEKNDPVRIEQDLMEIVPKRDWKRITDLLISLGRKVCVASKPKCDICVLNEICPSAFTFG